MTLYDISTIRTSAHSRSGYVVGRNLRCCWRALYARQLSTGWLFHDIQLGCGNYLVGFYME